MTIQELINRLQNSINNLEFNPDSPVQIDVKLEGWEDYMTCWEIHFDDTGVSLPKSVRECKERAKKEKEFQVAQENMAEDLINLGNTTAYAIHEIVMEELEINPHLDEYDLYEYARQSVAETIGSSVEP